MASKNKNNFSSPFKGERFLFIFFLVFVLGGAFYLVNTFFDSSLTGRFILDNTDLYANSNYSLPEVTIDTQKYLIFNITPDKFVLDKSNASSQIITINVTVSWPSEVKEAVVYSFGYYYSVSNRDWIPFLLNGNRIMDDYGDPTNWINRTGTKKLTLNVSGGKFFEGTNFIVAYGCMKVNGNWDCGCFDPSDGFSSQLKVCDNWMMQLFNTTNVIGGVGGENTCVFSQNCPTGYYCNSQEICVVNTSYVAPSIIVYLNECGFLGSANTHYILNKSLDCSTEDCFSCFFIEGDNITLDGAGHSTDNIILGNYPGVYRNSLTFRNISFTSLDGSDSLGELVLNDTTILGIMLSGTINQIRGNNFITESSLSAADIFLKNSHVQNLDVSGRIPDLYNCPPGYTGCGNYGGNITLINSFASNLFADGFSDVIGGSGGNLVIINSSLQDIYASGGDGPSDSGGAGGRIVLNQSLVNNIYLNGGYTYNHMGGSGGRAIIHNSILNLIVANSGSGSGCVYESCESGGNLRLSGITSSILSSASVAGPVGGKILFYAPCPNMGNIGTLTCDSGGQCEKNCPSSP